MSDSEKNFALRQAHEIASEDAYFDACSQTDSPDRRKVFGAGFERGWEAARAALKDRVAPAVRVEPKSAITLALELLQAMTVDMQNYIQPDSKVSDHEFANQMIYHLDGPQQRKVDAALGAAFEAEAVQVDMAKDAARYQWLRNPCNPVHKAYYSRGDYGKGLFTGAMLDDAIDAAMEPS